MRAAFPSDVIGPVVTAQTDLVDLTGFHLLHLADVPTRVVFRVRLAWPMTALAALRGRGGSWVLRLTVVCPFQRVALIGMTLEALRGADVPA